MSPRTLLMGLLLLAGIVLAGWVVLPRLGDLDDDRVEFGMAEPVDRYHQL